MTEAAETRLRRLRIRSWRRGMKEMDLILGHFADGPLALLDGADLDAYERSEARSARAQAAADIEAID